MQRSYLHEAELPRSARNGVGEKGSHQYLFILKPMLTGGWKISASYSHVNQKFLQERLILTSHPLPMSGTFSANALHWPPRAGVSLKSSNESLSNVLPCMSPGIGRCFC